VAATANTHSLLIALITAVCTGAPALIYTVVRGRKRGPQEEQELISRASKDAVDAMDTVLTRAREERQELLNKVDDLQRRVDQGERRETEQVQRIAHLESCVQQLRAGMAAPEC
jgi:Na+-translocating ferredoxin:NAD+ oxidoreductase RnfG subunit